MSNKRAEYEIQFTGKDGVSSVASRIAASVTGAQRAASAAIRSVTADLEAQGGAASAVTAKSKAAFDAMASGASGAASGISSAAGEVSRFIERLSSQKRSVEELTSLYSELKRQEGEAYMSGDDSRMSDLHQEADAVSSLINKERKLGAAKKEQTRANEDLKSSYTSAFETVTAELQSGDASLDEYRQSIEAQKQTIADLTEQYRRLKAAKADSGELAKLQQEINDNRGALSGMRDAVSKFSQSGVSLRTQIASVRNEMGKLRLEGKENTQEYESLRAEMERLGTAYRELQTEQTALSTGATQIGGVINGVQGLMGAYSVASGVVSLFVSDNERLAQVQTKMQSVMAVMMGMQQVSNTLHATSAFRIVTCRKVTELWTAAQNRLTVSLKLSSAAAKGLMASMTLGASLIITGVITAVSKLISKHRERKKQIEEEKKAEEDMQKSVRSSVSSSIASQLLSYRKLQQEWKRLDGELPKQRKFIKDNASEFKKLGVSVRSVKDAENVLVNGESAFVDSLKRRAMAAAAMELASKKYQTAIEKMLEAEDTREVTDDDRKNARSYAEGVYQQRVGAAKGTMGRAVVSGQRSRIVNEAYQSNIGTYGAERAKEYEDAAKKEREAGDRYFKIAEQYNRKADDILKGRGLAPASNGDGGTSAVSGSIDAIETKIKDLTAQMKSAGASERAELQKDINAWQRKLDAVNLEMEALSVPSDPKTIEELDTAISYYNKLLKVAGASERAEIQKAINGYTDKKAAIEDSLAGLKVPARLNTIDDYSNAISVLEVRLKKASASERAGIQANINALKSEQDEMKVRADLAAQPAVLESLSDYENAISACEAVLQYAGEVERKALQEQINGYTRKKEAIEDSLSALDIPSDPKSLEDIGKVISALQGKIQKAGEGEREEIQKEIDMWTAKRDTIEESLQVAGIDGMSDLVKGGLGLGDGELELKLRAKVVGADIARQKIEELRQLSAVAETKEDRKKIQDAISMWRKYTGTVTETSSAGEKVTGMLENMSSIAGSMSGVVSDNASGWLSWGASVLSAVASALPALAQVIGGNIAQAFAGATAQSQTVPFPYNLVALAASIAAVTAAVAQIPAYAEGGLAYGKTVGVFGEYPGASANPEVVAPLSKLKNYIGDAGTAGSVRFRIDGRTLVGVLQKEERHRSRM